MQPFRFCPDVGTSARGMPVLEPDLSSIAQLFHARTGMDLTGALGEHGRQGIRRAMARLGETDSRAFRERLVQDVGALDALIDELAVGETFFFRQPQHYDLFAEEVLPTVRARRAGGGPGVRVWSAGCASGEELYSVAAMLAEQGELEGAHLVGTDVSRGALARATEGRYRAWSVRGSAGQRMRDWLEPDGERFVIDARLRAAPRFFRLNLATDRYPERLLGLSDMDVVFCRNVLIYFDSETVERVACGLRETLAPGGWLLVGAADPTLPERCGLVPVIAHDVVVYRRPPVDIAPVAPRRSSDPVIRLEQGRETERRRSSRPPRPTPRRSAPPSERSSIEEVRKIAGAEPARALALSERALDLEPLSAELHYLVGVLCLGLGDAARAETALRRALYLDPSIALAHFVLGTVQRNRGELEAARSSFRNALREARRQPSDQPLPLADGDTAGALVRAAEEQLRSLGGEVGPT